MLFQGKKLIFKAPCDIIELIGIPNDISRWRDSSSHEALIIKASKFEEILEKIEGQALSEMLTEAELTAIQTKIAVSIIMP